MTHTRCLFFSTDHVQCEVWFPAADAERGPAERFCPAHRSIPSIQLENNKITDYPKKIYIEIENEERLLCHGLSLDEVEDRILQYENAMKELRIRALAQSSVRSEKLGKMTEEQRVERRKIKINAALAPASPRTPRQKAEPKNKLENSFKNVTADIAKQMALSLTEDDLDAQIALFKKRKAEKENGTNV